MPSCSSGYWYLSVRNRRPTERECVRTFTTEPRVIERNAIGLVILGVSLSADGQGLAITLRQDTTVVFTRMQQVGQREVSELQTQLTDDTGLSPTGREFHLVVSFGYQIVTYIYSSVFGLGWISGLICSGSKCPICWISRIERIRSSRLNRSPDGYGVHGVLRFYKTVVTIDADLY